MSTLNIDNWESTSGFNYNQIVQVRHAHVNTYQGFTNSSGAANDTALTLTITPKYSDSKIWVWVMAQIGHSTNSTVCRMRIKATGNGSTTYSPNSSGTSSSSWTTTLYNNPGSTSNDCMNPAQQITWLHSPSTTNTMTYTVQIANNSSSALVMLNGHGSWGDSWGGSSQIMLLEVKQ